MIWHFLVQYNTVLNLEHHEENIIINDVFVARNNKNCGKNKVVHKD